MADIAGLQITDPIVVAHTKDNRRQAVAQREDIKAGNFNGPAQVRTFSAEGKGVAKYSRVMVLQAHLKWLLGWEMVDKDEAVALAQSGLM